MIQETHILLVDDEKNYLLVLETLLLDQGYKVTALSDPESALDFLEQSEVDIVISDLKMPKVTGRDILFAVKKKYPHIPILIMTAFGSIESAVDLMRDGAFDYITKPFANEELLVSVKNAALLAQTHRQYKILQESISEKYATEHVVGQSKAMQNVRRLIEKSGRIKTSVMITGEQGTGKKLIAKSIHYSSERKDKPFITINCNAYDIHNFEIELYGIEKELNGTTTFKRGKIEQAHEGTLFLEEVTELSLELQEQLCELLTSKKVCRLGSKQSIDFDLSIIVSTSKNIKELVSEGLFREDLYYLLNIVEISIPPLRERREDISELVVFFSHAISEEQNIQRKQFTPEAINYLKGYDWEGNIMQLKNVLERCFVLVAGDLITDNDLPPEIRDEEGQFKSAVDLLPLELNLADTLDKIEAALIRRALAHFDFVQAHAADSLGISRSLIQYKLKKYNIAGH